MSNEDTPLPKLPIIRPAVLNMAQQLNELKIRFEFAKTLVPEYHGGSKSLFYFISNTEKFLANFTFNDATLTDYFLQYVISQIKGEAKDLVILNNPPSWIALKTLLLNKYKDPRSEQLLLTNLTSCFQKHSQTFEQYATELQSRLQSLKECVSLNTEDGAERNAKNVMFDNIAKNTFIAGVKEPYNTYLMNLQPISLDDCINKCRIYDDLKQQTNYHNFLRNSTQKHQQKPSFKPPQIQQIPTFSQPIRPNFSNFSRPFPEMQRPRAPFYQPQMRPNVFGPQNNSARQSQKPTPMSISTRQTPIQQQIPFKSNNFFRPTGPPNPYIHIEEIHQQNAEQEEHDHDYDEDQIYSEENYDETQAENGDENFMTSASTENST